MYMNTAIHEGELGDLRRAMASYGGRQTANDGQQHK